jgi:hypothetical protein
MQGSALAFQASPQVTSTITVAPVSARVAELADLPPGDWKIADFKLFITEEIERHAGPQLPCPQRDEILDGFWARYGPQGVMIARRAFEVYGGFWMAAPITVRRFEESQDVYFADVLLREIPAQ